MVEYAFIIKTTAPIFLLAATGFFIRRLKWLTKDADQSLLKLTLTLFYPCLIFDNSLGNEALFVPQNLIFPPIFGLSMILAGYLAAWILSRYLNTNRNIDRRTFSFTTGINNYGYIAFPIIVALFNDPKTTGVLFVHNIGVEIAFFSVGIVMISGTSLRDGAKKILNPMSLALALSVALNLSGLHAEIPEIATSAIHTLSQCAIPLGLILAGAILSDFIKDLSWLTDWQVPLGACAIRLLVIPCIVLIAAKHLPISIELKRVMLIQAAMPAGVFPLVMTKHFNGNVTVAIQVIVTTSIIGFFTIPLWIAFGWTWLDF